MKDQENMTEEGIVDAKNFKIAEKGQSTDALEKEEREKTKYLAKEAPKGSYICTTSIIIDGKQLNRGDEFKGKLYADLLESKSIVTKEEWNKRP